MTIQKQTWTILCKEKNLNENEIICIDNEEFHYLSNVLRLKLEDKVEITNCHGEKGIGIISFINKKEAKIKIEKVEINHQEKPYIHLYLGLPKPSTLEETISSLSEMGLHELHIFRTEKCVSKAPIKLDKLKRISDEATRISKSSFSTKIFYYENIHELFNNRKLYFEIGLNLFCDESHVHEKKIANSLLNVFQAKFNSQEYINLFVGPEASFSEKERDYIFKNLNCDPVSLGHNILRVPNAVYSAFSSINQILISNQKK
jgi:16S rRNA (uracil1498-N3)-methyltransferase